MTDWQDREESIVRVPLVTQVAPAECGLACLEMILRHYGTSPRKAELRRALRTSRDGVTALALVSAARRFGLDAEGFSVDGELIEHLPMPAILHITGGHFVVLEGIEGEIAHIVDPARGRLRVPRQEFASTLSGVAIGIEGNPAGFAPDPRAWRVVYDALRPERRTVLLALLAQVLAATTVILLARTLGHAVDVWTLSGHRLPTAETWQLAALTTVYAALTLAFSRLDGDSRSRTSSRLVERFVNSLSTVSLSYIEAREAGLVQFMADIDLLFGSAHLPPNTFFSLVTAGIFTVTLAMRSMAVAAGLGICIVVLSLAAVFHRSRERDMAARRERWSRHERKTLETALRKLVDLRANSGQRAVFAEWRLFREELGKKDGLRETSEFVTRGAASPLFITLLVVTCLVAIQQSTQSPAPGNAVEVVVLAICALTSWTLGLQALVEANAWVAALQRSSDLFDEARQPSAGETFRPGDTSDSEYLMTVSDLTLSLGRRPMPVLSRICLTIKEGESIAVIGGPGAGKTAIAQILLGLRMPTAGRIILAGKDLRTYSEFDRRHAVGGLLDTATLSDGTITENVRFGNAGADASAIRRACEFVGVESEVECLPLGYDTHLLESALTISRSTHNKLLLARALVEPPRIFVVDSLIDRIDTASLHVLIRNLRANGSTFVFCTSHPQILDHDFRFFRLEQGSLTRA